jgi:hypothetical protein
MRLVSAFGQPTPLAAFRGEDRQRFTAFAEPVVKNGERYLPWQFALFEINN